MLVEVVALVLVELGGALLLVDCLLMEVVALLLVMQLVVEVSTTACYW